MSERIPVVKRRRLFRITTVLVPDRPGILFGNSETIEGDFSISLTVRTDGLILQYQDYLYRGKTTGAWIYSFPSSVQNQECKELYFYIPHAPRNIEKRTLLMASIFILNFSNSPQRNGIFSPHFYGFINKPVYLCN